MVLMLAGCLSTLTQSSAIGDDSEFKENQILRDEDDATVAAEVATENADELSLEDQVRLLSKQMSALMTRRREDFKLLENSLKKSVRKNAAQMADADVKAELDKLR